MFKEINLKFLDDMENQLLLIKCGLNIKKRIRVKRYIKSISIVKKNIIEGSHDVPCLADRWFMESLLSFIALEGGKIK